MNNNRKISWLDWFVYKLFCKRWNPILQQRPDLREIFIAFFKAFDTIDQGEQITVTITKRRNGD